MSDLYDLRLPQLRWFAARLKHGDGPVKIAIRVVRPLIKNVVPGDDLISMLRCHFRNGARVAATMIVGSEGTSDYAVSPAFSQEIHDRIYEDIYGTDAGELVKLGIATMILQASIRTVLADIVELPGGITPDSASMLFDKVESKCRTAIFNTLLIMNGQAGGRFTATSDLRDQAIAVMTKLAMEAVEGEKRMSIMTRLAVKEGFVAAWMFQRDQKLYQESLGAAKTASADPMVEFLGTGAFDSLKTGQFENLDSVVPVPDPSSSRKPAGLGRRPVRDLTSKGGDK